MGKSWIRILSLVAVSLLSPSLRAQAAAGEAPEDRAPTLNIDGMTGIGRTHSAKTLGSGRLGLGTSTWWNADEAVLRGGQITYNYLTAYAREYWTSTTKVFLSVGAAKYLDLGLSMPFHYDYIKFGDRVFEEWNYGDLKYMGKIGIPQGDADWLRLALLLGGTAPFQSNRGLIPRDIDVVLHEDQDPTEFRNGSSPLGTATPNFFGALALSLVPPDGFPLEWHINAGMQKTNVDDEPDFDDIFFYSTALQIRPLRFVSLFTEFQHESRFENVGTRAEWRREPTRLTAGTVLHIPYGFDLHLGGVLGLFREDYNRYRWWPNAEKQVDLDIKATPEASAYAELTWNGFIIPQDDDRDGIKNKVDACPDRAEDEDGFQDGDGCPDPDNDKDGVADAADRCPMQAEDKDGFQDRDGCPDADNDRDGIADSEDKCPDEPQNAGTAPGRDGCPNLDRDNDGFADASDRCPGEGEDKDGFEDGDGCPEVDNDRDGIPDSADKCPNVPEVVNRFADEDGCPDSMAVQIEKGKTLVLKGVNFKTGSAELTPESFGILEGVASSLREIREAVIEVQGHTDNTGSAATNTRLSQRRAETVAKFLAQRGVAANRLRAVGYGPARPVASNKTAEGRALNRRVELARLE